MLFPLLIYTCVCEKERNNILIAATSITNFFLNYILVHSESNLTEKTTKKFREIQTHLINEADEV